MRDINFYNQQHLGDSVFHVQYLRKLCENYHDLRFFYYINKSYFKEINAQINEFKDRIILMPLKDMPEDSICAWAGARVDGVRMPVKAGKKGRIFLLNERYKIFYDMISKQIGVDNPIDNNGMVMDNPVIAQKLDNDLNPDVLIINSIPQSKQYRYNSSHFETQVEAWKDRYSIVVTKRLYDESIPCTLDYGLNLLQIGHLSINAKYVIAIATAPIINCFNKWNIDTVEKWFVLSNRSTYSYNDRIERKISVKGVTI